MSIKSHIRFFASASMLTLLALSTGGCSSVSMRDITGSISEKTASASPAASAPQSDAEWRQVRETYGERYRANPKDAEAAMRYGQALRALGQRAQSAAVFEQAALSNPGNKGILAAYGRAQIDNGAYQQGFDTISQAHTPDNPDWHLLSVQGTALDRLGRGQEARMYYANALKIRPGEASVLSNLGMSYILAKQLPQAEEALRQAHGNAPNDARIRQNLALAIGLQGRRSEAEGIVTAGLPEAEAADSVSQLRQMLGQNPRENNGKRGPKSAEMSSAHRS
jgi:Flp pilus assembly protein TadD